MMICGSSSYGTRNPPAVPLVESVSERCIVLTRWTASRSSGVHRCAPLTGSLKIFENARK
jgi:hypothetical protein